MMHSLTLVLVLTMSILLKGKKNFDTASIPDAYPPCPGFTMVNCIAPGTNIIVVGLFAETCLPCVSLNDRFAC